LGSFRPSLGHGDRGGGRSCQRATAIARRRRGQNCDVHPKRSTGRIRRRGRPTRGRLAQPRPVAPNDARKHLAAPRARSPLPIARAAAPGSGRSRAGRGLSPRVRFFTNSSNSGSRPPLARRLQRPATPAKPQHELFTSRSAPLSFGQAVTPRQRPVRWRPGAERIGLRHRSRTRSSARLCACGPSRRAGAHASSRSRSRVHGVSAE
jgi:hypothetical protein